MTQRLDENTLHTLAHFRLYRLSNLGCVSDSIIPYSSEFALEWVFSGSLIDFIENPKKFHLFLHFNKTKGVEKD